MLTFDNIREILIKEHEVLEFEVTTLSQTLFDTHFFNHNSNFPNAHYGYLMVCMSRIDLWSSLWAGLKGKGHGTSPISGSKFQSQTDRMIVFMHTYFDPDKSEEHRLAVHLFRHKLMHTGSLRYLYDREHNIKYTWRIFFGEFEWYQVKAIHYTITDEDDNNPGELATLIPSSGITNSSIRALNVSIPRFVENLRFTLFRYLDEAERDTNMRQNMELSFSHLQFHEFN